jgi:hypothetical protein
LTDSGFANQVKEGVKNENHNIPIEVQTNLITMCCCCSKCEDESNPSECQCSPCRYRNGLIPLLAAQVLIFLSFALSFYATWDCHFVTVDANLVSGILDEIERSADDFDFNLTVPSNATTRGLGFFLWEGINGDCTPHDTEYTENMYDRYHDFLGSDWNAPRAMATLATVLAFALMIWLFIFSCVAQPKAIRYGLAVVSIVLMPIFQAVPFMVLNSDFCNENDCSLGRSAKYAAGATSIYALIGVAFLFTQTFPKPKPLNQVAAVDKDVEEPPVQVDAKEDVVEEVPADTTMQDISLVDESPESVEA